MPSSRTPTASHSRRSLLSYSAIALLAVTAATAQVATGIDNSGNYRSEAQACMSGQSHQDRETCLREARNAEAERRHGALGDAGPLAANALARCAPFTAEDKAACHARVMGQGTTTGSVQGGGVLREVETVVPASNQDLRQRHR